MAREYFKMFHSYLKSIEPLDDAERGRLFTAMLEYSITGEAPALTGNERFLFPTMQANIDRGIEGYEAMVEANRVHGRRGGRPRKTGQASDDGEETRPVSEEPDCFLKSQDKDKEEDKDNDNDKDKGYDKEVGDARAARTPTRAERVCGEANGRHGGGEPERFVPPTVEEVADYVKQRGSRVDPQGFVDYYAAKGWMAGQTPMRDWRAACRSAEHWERWSRDSPSRGGAQTQAPGTQAAERNAVDQMMRLYDRMRARDDWTDAADPRCQPVSL